MLEMPPKRSEKYPVVGMALDPDKVAVLKKHAEEQMYTNRRGVLAGALAKDLFERAWPLFRAAEFDPRRVRSLGADADKLSEWFWEFYRHLPPDSRRGIMRGLSERYNFRAPPEVRLEDERADSDEGRSKGGQDRPDRKPHRKAGGTG